MSAEPTGSAWQVISSVRADVTAEALKEILGELDALAKDRPLSDEEIATAREAESRSFPESFEDPKSIVSILAGLAQFHLPDDYLETYLDRLRQTPDPEIRKTMVEVVVPTDRTILIVGDRDSVEPKLKAQGFRDIRLVNPDGKPIGH